MSDAPESPSGDNDKYVVVARRYRPLQFDQLVGQAAVRQALINAIESGRVGHAYLFTGARGVGKTSTARIFAKALNAPEGSTATPDNQSDICQAIDAGEDVDVLEIDGASNRGIDEIRQLRAGVGMRPSRSRYKIYIIDEVHMLTQQAFNALLKTLEEPPEHVKFIFCTTDPEKIPITVLSRCQRFDFAPIETSEIQGRLAEIVQCEGASADQEALQLLARRANGSMRDSQSLLEQILSFSTGHITVDQIHAMLGTADDARLSKLLDTLSNHLAAEALGLVDGAVMAGIDAGQLSEQLLGYYRDVLVASVGGGATMLRHAPPSAYEDLQQRGEAIGTQTILAIVGILDQAITRMRQSVHSRVLLEAALVQICQLRNLQSIADVAAGLSNVSPAAGSAGRTAVQKKTAPITKPPTTAASSPAQPSEKKAVSDDAPKPSPPVAAAAPTPNMRWDSAHARHVWNSAIAELDDMTANHARNAEKVEAAEDGVIRVIFPGDRQLDKASCEKPDRKNKLEAALAQVANRQVRYECVLTQVKIPEKPVTRAVTSAQRAKRMREIEQEPTIQQMLEIFQGEVIRIENPDDSSN